MGCGETRLLFSVDSAQIAAIAVPPPPTHVLLIIVDERYWVCIGQISLYSSDEFGFATTVYIYICISFFL